MTKDQLRALAERLREGCRDIATGERLRPGEFAWVSIEDVEAAAEYLRQRAQSDAVEVLRELVALKDMKERLRDLHERGHGTDYEDYYRLKPLAWERARTLLAKRDSI